jgi:PmbA protein
LVVEGTALSIEVLKGKIEKAERAEGLDLGLRVLVGQRQALISSSTASTDAIAEMAARAVSMARDAPEDATLGLAEPATSYSNRALHLATSNGFAAGYKRTTTGLYAVAITGAGSEMERDSYGDGRTYRTDLPTPEEVGRLAGERTVERKGARKPPTGSYPVLYDERGSSSLIGHRWGRSAVRQWRAGRPGCATPWERFFCPRRLIWWKIPIAHGSAVQSHLTPKGCQPHPAKSSTQVA